MWSNGVGLYREHIDTVPGLIPAGKLKTIDVRIRQIMHSHKETRL